MNLHLRAAGAIDSESLRTLLIDAADELAGVGSRILEPKLPWDGHPILLADADAHPVLVSFDIEDGATALLKGLQASDHLNAALPWLNQVYDALRQLQRPPRLVVVTGSAPPGCEILTGNRALSLLTCRVLRVNENLGLLLEPVDAPTAATPAPTVAERQPAERMTLVGPEGNTAGNSTEGLAELSPQERVYFQQL